MLDLLVHFSQEKEVKEDPKVNGRISVLMKILQKRKSSDLTKDLVELVKKLDAKKSSAELLDEVDKINKSLKLDSTKIDAFHGKRQQREVCALSFKHYTNWDAAFVDYEAKITALESELFDYQQCEKELNETTMKFEPGKPGHKRVWRSNNDVENVRFIHDKQFREQVVTQAVGDPKINLDAKALLAYLTKKRKLSHHPKRLLEQVCNEKNKMEKLLKKIEEQHKWAVEALKRAPLPEFKVTEAEKDMLKKEVNSIPDFSPRITAKKTVMFEFIEALSSEEKAVQKAESLPKDLLSNLPSTAYTGKLEACITSVEKLAPARAEHFARKKELEEIESELEWMSFYS